MTAVINTGLRLTGGVIFLCVRAFMLLLASGTATLIVCLVALFPLTAHFGEWLSFTAAGVVLGHFVALPSLAMFFYPWSIWKWRKGVPVLLSYILTGIAAAGLNGLALIGLLSTRNDSPGIMLFVMGLFTASGGLTALFHWLLLKKPRFGDIVTFFRECARKVEEI